ncbi:MAG: hypothetical protein M3389_11560 [Actinomycetota bacterium]|nr:hypothetical protein [Actinomycetota bacterium]
MTGSGADPDHPSTEELRAVQVEREEAEREMAERAAEPREERTHERRADRAAYLRSKLEEQAEADES